jgi:CelD/BcsL family acetyltransferase involved in cellulose biosynthesis
MMKAPNKQRGNGSMVEQVEQAPGFEWVREDWAPLLDVSPSRSLFLTWEWLSTWWRHLSGGRSLRLLVVRSHGEAVAIAPLSVRPPQWTRLSPMRALEFMGTGSVGSDYLDLIIKPGYERQAVFAIADDLRRRRLMLELSQMNRTGCLAAELARQLGRYGWTEREQATAVCPWIKLSGHTWDSYLATLGQGHRSNLRRQLKLLNQRFEVRFEQVRSEEERGEALQHLIMLHGLRWQERGGSNALHEPGLRAFHEDFSRLALERGWLRLFVLRLNGQPVAALYGFRFGRVFYFYQSGFDPAYATYSMGSVIVGLTIKQAIEEGAEEYDFLHGDEPYKFHWAKEQRELGRLELYPPHAAGWLCKGAVDLGRAARTVARRVLPDAMIHQIIAGKGKDGCNDAARAH